MKSLLLYLAGVLTPFAVSFAFSVKSFLADWRDGRRYARAWKKFSDEFDALPPQRLAVCRALWADEPWRYGNYADDRSRYFVMRWQHGHATDV